MAKALTRELSQNELRNLTRTVDIRKKASAKRATQYRPKVRYVATEDTSVLKIMSGVVNALQQKGLSDKADELRRLVLGGAYDEPLQAFELMAKYVLLKIVDQEGQEICMLR